MTYSHALARGVPSVPRPAARTARGPGHDRSLPDALGRIADALAGAIPKVRVDAGVAFPRAVALFWAFVVCVDFVNDWIIVGITTSFRPLHLALLDVVVWWSPWVLASPILAIPIRRLDPRRIGWSRSLRLHLVLMVLAISLHALVAAWIFVAVRGGSVLGDFAHFARAFTLSEALLYGGLVAACHVSGPGFDALPAAGGDDEARAEGDASWLRRFAVRDGDVTRFVPVDAVSHIEAAGNYVRVHTADDEHLIRATLSGVAGRLDPGRFRRIHRSTIVNVDRVARVDAWFNGDAIARLDDGRELRVSRTYRTDLIDPLE